MRTRRAPTFLIRRVFMNISESRCFTRSVLWLLLLLFGWHHLDVRAADALHIRVQQYPLYTPALGEASPPKEMPKVPVIHDSAWVPGCPHEFFVMDESQILPAGKCIWSVHDEAKGFCLGCNCMCVCSNGSTAYGDAALYHPQRKWYLWFRWHGKASQQPLRYAFSDSTLASSPYAPPEPDRKDLAYFHPAIGASYLQYWKDHKTELTKRIVLNDDNSTTSAEPKAAIWRQYAEICPKTYTDTLRWEFGLEGPANAPEPTFTGALPCVDLRPGMRLRVDYSIYSDAVSAPARDSGIGEAEYLNRGFVGTGTSYFHVTRLPRSFATELGPFSVNPNAHDESVLVLDPFFGHMRQSVDLPSLDVVGGRPNVVNTGFDVASQPYDTCRYMRLAYPLGDDSTSRLLGIRNGTVLKISHESLSYLKDEGAPQEVLTQLQQMKDKEFATQELFSREVAKLLTPDEFKAYEKSIVASATSGNRRGTSDLFKYPRNHAALIGSDERGKLSTLELATYISKQDFKFKQHDSTPPDPRTLFVFRGRTFLVPEIAIVVNGSERYVAVGTRLRQLVATQLDDSPKEIIRHRGRLLPVTFDNDPSGTVLEVPLMKGDTVSW